MPAGTAVSLRLRTFHNDVTGVRARVYDLNTSSQRIYNLTLAASDVSCYQPGLENFTCDFWEVTLSSSQPDNQHLLRLDEALLPESEHAVGAGARVARGHDLRDPRARGHGPELPVVLPHVQHVHARGEAVLHLEGPHVEPVAVAVGVGLDAGVVTWAWH